ncbi:MAG: motility associated factor glycosyltransferase family protein [Lachnospiraceae bacterium]|nr:motility associated factor glycosyltransferase family protein [Lachnospiraceae bacterium]
MQDITTFRFRAQLFVRNAKIWIRRARNQEISLADNQLEWLIGELETVLSHSETGVAAPMVLENFNLFMEAYQNRDYILAADYMESGVLAPLQDVVTEVVSALPEPESDGEYRVEYTASGMTTVAKQIHGKWFYLHSNNCPAEDAMALANTWQENGVSRYIVAGLGFGYQAVYLSENPLVQVEVYEEDERMVALAKAWSDMPVTLRERKNLRIIHDPGYRKFAEAAQEAERHPEEKICLYYPSLQTIREDSLRDRMNRLFMQIDNAKRWAGNLLLNFRYNTSRISHEIGELKEKFQGKTVYLIAGGPSLDGNIHTLVSHRKAVLEGKEQGADELVLTVGTSLKRCIAEGVSPDYAIITDPKESVYSQIQGIEDSSVPMILLSTAFAWIARDYQGKKYLACQTGYELAEKMAEEHGWQTVASGSSVTTTALDICIRLGAARVVFLGLDLAFTGGRSHQGVKEADSNAVSELMVPDIYGNPVATSKNLNLYREWLERRIARAKKEGSLTEFIDASEGGARVEGTQIVKLSDIIK